LSEGPEKAVVEENKTKTEEPKVLPPNLVIEVNDMVKRVEQLEIDVKDAGLEFEGKTGEEKDLINEWGLIEDISKEKTSINELKKQLEDLKLAYKTSSELDFELGRIDLELKKIRRKVPKEIGLIEKTEFMQSYNEKDSIAAVNEIFTNFNEKEKNEYLSKNKKIQGNLNIEVKINVISIEYLDGTKNEQTLVRKKVSYSNPEPIEDVIMAEIIPKTIADNKDEINFELEGYEIIKEDPLMIKFGFLKLDYEGKIIKYSIEKKLNIEDVKGARSVVLIGPTQLEKASNVVGFSIFSFFKNNAGFTNAERGGIMAGFIIIAILSGYYFVVIKGGMVKLRSAKQRIMAPRIRTKEKMDNKIIDFENYPHIPKIAKKMQESEDNESKEYKIIKKLISESQEFISADEFNRAALIYPKIELLYRNLPKGVKPDVYRQCVELQKSIREGKEEFYKGIL